MSGSVCRATFSVIVADTQFWTESEYRKCLGARVLHDDWAAERLWEAMRLAGQAFIEEHPDLYMSPGLI